VPVKVLATEETHEHVFFFFVRLLLLWPLVLSYLSPLYLFLSLRYTLIFFPLNSLNFLHTSLHGLVFFPPPFFKPFLLSLPCRTNPP